jgi:hypothetical protein
MQMALRAQVLFHRERFIEALGLKDHAHFAPHRRGFANHIVSGDGGAAFGGRHHGGKNAEQRGFAAAVRAQKSENFALLYVEGDLRKRDAVPVAMSQIADFNHRPGLSKSIRP